MDLVESYDWDLRYLSNWAMYWEDHVIMGIEHISNDEIGEVPISRSYIDSSSLDSLRLMEEFKGFLVILFVGLAPTNTFRPDRPQDQGPRIWLLLSITRGSAQIHTVSEPKTLTLIPTIQLPT